MAMHARVMALGWLLLMVLMVCGFALILMGYAWCGYSVLVCCMLLFVGWYLANKVRLLDEERQRERVARSLRLPEEGTPRWSPIMIEIMGAENIQQWEDVQVVGFVPRARIARLAIRALPPVRAFNGDQIDCPICMEEFKNGELIQPFGVCVHQFHSSCLNSWLLAGKITCPVCRTQLSSPHQ